MAYNVSPVSEVADQSEAAFSLPKIMFLRETTTSGYRKLGNFAYRLLAVVLILQDLIRAEIYPDTLISVNHRLIRDELQLKVEEAFGHSAKRIFQT